MTKESLNIPKEVKETIKTLHDAGFEAYAAGGCVRDFILGREPYDWDITTNAKPEEIQKIFLSSVYENDFGTVAINTESLNPKLKIIEITKKLEDDLSRRDFTVNAMALEIQNSKFKIQNDNSKFKIVDPFGGQDDIKNKIIRTVGNPDERFNEDALRLMRAARFAVQLGFNIEEKTAEAIRKNSGDLVAISKERIRDEFSKIIMTKRAKTGIETLRDFDLLKHIIPELEEGWGVGQNKHHIYTIWEHNLRSLDWAATHGYKLENLVASLLHDVRKPRTKKGNGSDSTFYNHEVIGAKMAAKILERLKFPKKFIEKVESEPLPFFVL